MTAGVVGLGNMGSALAENLVGAGLSVLTHDAAGDERNPEGATFTDDLGDLARRAEVVVLSLPNGSISQTVATGIATTTGRLTTTVVDTSTVGVAAARTIGATLAASGIEYVDAPVSGGPAGARARTLAIMYAATDSAVEQADVVLRGLSDRRYRVGNRPGLGQVIKLANNFLSATALAAASEAMAFGVSEGIEMSTMLEVLNAASGRSAATEDKFVNHVLTEKYSSGFANTLMTKDLRLYLEAVTGADAPAQLGTLTVDTWERFTAAEPGVDFTRIYPFVASE
jgi:3-hydroxyisobutyrate dehydrogenase